ncbi:MAG: MerR family transcriptional regulator [Calditrichota bacterium]
MPQPDIIKLYYSISEVSAITGVEPHVLRYWETEFRELSPRKHRGGKRLYRETDIRLALRIKTLLYDERFTLEGARKKLRENGAGENERNSPALDVETQRRWSEIREGLQELQRLIDGDKG